MSGGLGWKWLTLLVVVIFSGAGRSAYSQTQPQFSGVVSCDFVFEKAPFQECHASTLVETSQGLLVAWFAGTKEGRDDVGIWLSHQDAGRWSPPSLIVDGRMPDGKRFPCWNPVLFQPRSGPLHLFYKVGSSPSTWWGEFITSEDQGKTWTSRKRLPDGILGPIKNKPLELADGTWLSPSSTEHNGWRIHFERSDDQGKTWKATLPVKQPDGMGAIQPTLLVHPGRQLQAIGRTRGSGKIFETWSSDNGVTWSPLKFLDLPNPNSGIDAVTLASNEHVLIYNHTNKGRSPLNVAVSRDGHAWQAVAELEHEPGEYSYPAIIQTADNRVHVLYTWKRLRLRHVVLDPAKIRRRAIENGVWPMDE